MDFFHEALRRFSAVDKMWSRKQVIDELVSIEMELYHRGLVEAGYVEEVLPAQETKEV